MDRTHRSLLAVMVSLLVAATSGCSTAKFYSQAIHGQAEILRKARPVVAVMRDTNVSGEVRRKLALTQDLRRFADEHLGLPADRLYDTYTDLGRSYVSWVVYAAPEFSVEAKTWWYPLLGPLEYRGFFSKNAAEKEAAHLRSKGYEVFVENVTAYSTLGWFRDPVLNTFFDSTDADLAELVFHELTHVKLFLPGDTDFNEAFATANAENGVRCWLKSKGDHAALARYETTLAKDREITRLLLQTREKLEHLYLSESRSGVAQMRRGKAAILERMQEEYARIRARWRGDSRYDRTFSKPWNNARLNAVATYYDLVPGFERLLRAKRGDLKAFYAAVETMRTLNKTERRAALGGD
jgi:predicted aminopeptidase